VTDEPLGLVRYDAMRRAIAEAHSIDEVKDIRDRALALETYARQAMNEEDERRCREIRQRAERKVGQGLKEMAATGERHSGRGDQKSASRAPIPKLSDWGISLDQSSDWQRVAGLSDEEFEAALAQDASTSNMVELAKNKENPARTTVTPVADEALWLWGRLRDFEREDIAKPPLLKQSPADVLETLPGHMLDDVCALASKVAAWLSQIGKPP
jgi:hypothetical protein